MKKILISVVFFLLTLTNTYGADTAFDSPLISNLGTETVNNFAGNIDTFDPISSSNASRMRFCESYGGTYISHTTRNSGIGRAQYSTTNDEWSYQTNNTSILSIICDLPEPPISGGITGGLSVDGTTGSGALHVLTVNQGRVYIEHDNFLFVFVSLLVVTLLFTSLIVIFIGAINFGKNLSQGYKPKVK